MKNTWLIFLVCISKLFAQSPESLHFQADSPSFFDVVSKTNKLEEVGKGFQFTEGPVWDEKNSAWLFSDIPANTIVKIAANGTVSDYLKPSGNSNGLAFSPSGELFLCEHSGRRISKWQPDTKTCKTIISTYNGKKFNSPNDITFRKDGSFYFTDPPYGLANGDADTSKQLSFNGLYFFSNGKINLLDTLRRPNGVALSPDQRTLYVTQSEGPKQWRAYKLGVDGFPSEPFILLDNAASHLGEGSPDGVKTDVKGNVYATGPGGVHIFDKNGKHLGVIKTPFGPTNCAFGEKEYKTLFITCPNTVYKITLLISGFKQ